MTRWALLVLAVAGPPLSERTVRITATPQSVCGASPTSRWSAGGRAYAATAEFGASADDWIASLHGTVATRGGEVFVHDGRTPQIVVLDQQLRLRRKFGRMGAGPGELTRRPFDEGLYGAANTLSATDSMLLLSDMSRVMVFRHDGRFVGEYRTPRVRFPVSFDVRGLGADDSGIVLGYHDGNGVTGEQRMQTWRLTPDQPRLVDEMVLPSLPRSGQRYITGNRQSRPLWATFQGCVYVGDGTSSWLIRMELATGRKDTLRLPPHSVPPYRVTDMDRRREAEVRGRGIAMSFTTPPSALWKYMQLRVDPDGHLWVSLWQPTDSVRAPITYRIDPAGGIHAERIPAFPMAFGPPGVYYARGVKPDTDEILIRRYERKP